MVPLGPSSNLSRPISTLHPVYQRSRNVAQLAIYNIIIFAVSLLRVSLLRVSLLQALLVVLFQPSNSISLFSVTLSQKYWRYASLIPLYRRRRRKNNGKFSGKALDRLLEI